MKAVVGNFFALYLILPLIGILLGLLLFFIAKKNQLLKDKKSIFYILLTCIVLALPGLFGFVNYWFMPYIYISLVIVYLFFGWYNLSLLNHFFPSLKEKSYYLTFLFQFVIMFIGGALFSLAFNLCNELKYGWWASSCILSFLLPTLFIKMYDTYLDIPLEIYKIWSYEIEVVAEKESFFDENKLMVVELELFKAFGDAEPFNIKVKATESAKFGVWFKIFIDDYNFKSPSSPIIHTDSSNSYGWIFYRLNWLGIKKYIDPEYTFGQNKIKEKYVIMAKRVTYSENIEEGSK